jgi:Fe-S-cluster containining protein
MELDFRISPQCEDFKHAVSTLCGTWRDRRSAHNVTVMTQTRQQQRQLQREYVKLGRSAMTSGLPPQPKRDTVLGVALVLKSKLTERGNNLRAGEAAGLAHALIEKSLTARSPKISIACRSGCAYCCYSFVGVTAPEVFRLAHAVRKSRNEALKIGDVRARGVALQGLSPAERPGRKLPCPLLVGDLCGVYHERPMVCRQATSLSLEACVDEFENAGKYAEIPVSSLHLAYASNVHVAFLGALTAAGYSSDAYEMSAALDIALGENDAESRWLAGEQIFARLPAVVRPSGDVDAVARKIAEAIA